MRNIQYSIAAILLYSAAMQAQETISLKPEKFISLEIPEPSDICFRPDGKSMFIVSDNGYLFETDTQGKIIRKADYAGMDDEAVYVDEKFVYAVEEVTRKIKIFNINTLKLERTVYLPYAGGRNKGYEAFTFNKAKNKFVILTEKDPIYLFELDTDLKVVNEISLGKIARDIASATYYNDFLWLLSDEDMTVFKVDPNSYEVLGKWSVPIINPEGIAFDKNGNMLIQSDDMKRLYFFKNPEKQ
ncbi:MAG: SdiA-regulated domain-containing protein [Flavobacterium sp.]|nr:SdiA-regulated domain-containing protein [Flavobacterium sp.]